MIILPGVIPVSYTAKHSPPLLVLIFKCVSEFIGGGGSWDLTGTSWNLENSLQSSGVTAGWRKELPSYGFSTQNSSALFCSHLHIWVPSKILFEKGFKHVWKLLIWNTLEAVYSRMWIKASLGVLWPIEAFSWVSWHLFLGFVPENWAAPNLLVTSNFVITV